MKNLEVLRPDSDRQIALSERDRTKQGGFRGYFDRYRIVLIG